MSAARIALILQLLKSMKPATEAGFVACATR